MKLNKSGLVLRTWTCLRTWLILWISEVLGLLLLNFDLFPIAPLFLWVLATYPIFYPTLSMAPLQP